MTKERTCSCLPMLCAYMEQDNSAKQLKELHGSNCNLFLRFDHSLLLPFLCCWSKKLSCVFAPPNCNVWLFITVIPRYLKIGNTIILYHIWSFIFLRKNHVLAISIQCPCYLHAVSGHYGFIVTEAWWYWRHWMVWTWGSGYWGRHFSAFKFK